MRYGDNKPKYIRWLFFTGLLAISVLLQNSAGGLLEFFGAKVFLCIPCCVMISMFEREVPAAVFGAFAGALWDVSAGVDGFNTMVLMLLCAVVSLLISHLMRNNVITALVLGTAGIAVYEVFYMVIRLWRVGNSFGQMFTFYLPSLLITVPFVPLCYILVKFIYNSYRIAE